jgi:periplasmic divalent cation tolerance protein
MGTPAPAATVVEIRTTFPGRAAAEACVRRVVAARLAACGQIDGPVGSVYRWRDAVETAEEWRCTFKTTPDGAAACAAALVAGHPYELPEVLLATVVAAEPYAAWVRHEVVVP